MSCNCSNTNTCPNLNDCRCGITLDIYNSIGTLVESTQASIYGNNDYFYDVESSIWNSVLGQSYDLTIEYNDSLDRWELSYFDNDLDQDIVIGVLYGSETCPTYGCWDLDCISFIFQPRLIQWVITWNGEFFNGRKKYTSSFNDPGVGGQFTWNFFFGDDGRWTITRTPGNTGNWAYALGNTECIPTNVIWYNYADNSPTLYKTFPLGVTGYDLKVTAIDCGCCDTEIIVTINGVDYTAEVEYDEYGNVLGNNGKQYYVFLYEGNKYYVYFNGTNWVIATNCERFYRITEDNKPRIIESGEYRIIN